MVICLGRGADMHMAQLMQLPLIISCASKSRLVLPFWYWLTLVVPDKGLINGCCCCAWIIISNDHIWTTVFSLSAMKSQVVLLCNVPSEWWIMANSKWAFALINEQCIVERCCANCQMCSLLKAEPKASLVTPCEDCFKSNTYEVLTCKYHNLVVF